MELKRIRTALLATTVILSPMALLGQLYPDTTSPVQQQQPMQQQQSPNRAASHTPLSDSNATPGLTGQEMKDKMFLRKSAETGIATVKLGQLAADKGSAEDVKALGSRMVADHTQLTTDMKPIADSMGIRLPKDMNKEDKATYDKLAALSGAEFDKAYILATLEDHRKDWRAFHEESMGTNDPVLKAEVDKDELVIRDHVRMVVKMAKDRNILPARPTPPPAAPQQ
jgi:putative membrane protein